MLASIVLALGHNARGNVRDAHSRVGFVDVLTAGPAGAVCVDAQVGRIDGDCLCFVGFCQNRHCAGAGVNSALCFGGWHALHAVTARFKAQVAKHVVTFDPNDYLFVAA